MTTYEKKGKQYCNDGKIYDFVEEWEDNGTPDEPNDHTFIQEISRVEVGLMADRETCEMLKGVPKLMIAEESLDIVSANVTVLKSWFSDQIGLRIDNNGNGSGTYQFVYQYTVPNKYAKNYRARIKAIQAQGATTNCTIRMDVRDTEGNDLDDDSVNIVTLTDSVTLYEVDVVGNQYTIAGEKIILIITIVLPDTDDRVFTTIPSMGII